MARLETILSVQQTPDPCHDTKEFLILTVRSFVLDDYHMSFCTKTHGLIMTGGDPFKAITMNPDSKNYQISEFEIEIVLYLCLTFLRESRFESVSCVSSSSSEQIFQEILDKWIWDRSLRRNSLYWFRHAF